MAKRRNRSGQFLCNRRRRSSAPRASKPKAGLRARGQRSAVMVVNPHRRRHHRRYRSNPSFAGIGLNQQTFKSVGLVAGGLLGTPFVEGFVRQYLPLSLTTSKLAAYAVKIGCVLGLGWGAGKLLGKEEGQKVFLGGAAYVAVSAVKEFMPTLFPTSTSTTPAVQGLRGQPLLGSYGGYGITPQSSLPSRLQAAGRY